MTKKRDWTEGLLADGIDRITIQKFADYHRENPDIWREFERVALQAISEGIERWGSKSIAEIVRWNLRRQKRGEWKLNNNYPAYYARIFAMKHPQHKAFFEFRECRGLK